MEEDGGIDPLSTLTDQPVYIQTGINDEAIIPDRQEAEVIFYENFGANVLHSVKDMGHVWAADVQPGKRTPIAEDC